MPFTTRRSVEQMLRILAGPTGLRENLEALAEVQGLSTELADVHIAPVSVAADLFDKIPGGRYPAVLIRCESITNTMKEKFRQFSGTVKLVVEVRVTHDRIEAVEQLGHLYTGAVVRVLDQHRGDWGDGMFYPGGYEAVFQPIKHGGKNFQQTASVRLDVDLSY